MRTIARWTFRLLTGIVALALLAAGLLFVLSERVMGRSYDVEGSDIAVPGDSASIEEGRRLATLRGCYDGCHGPAFGGEVFMDGPFPFNVLFGRLVAPDLTRLAAERSNAQLERSIRHGVNDDGTSVMAMPSEMFAGLSDGDLAKILAALRAEARSGGPSTSARFGPMARYFIWRGGFAPAATLVDHDAAPPATTPTDPLALGGYLARTVCSECHGVDLLGAEAVGPSPAIPALSIVGSYPPDRFRRLMREGVPADGRELGLMREVALGRFVHFTDAELDAIHAYLSRPETWSESPAPGSE